jgi:maltooligosyltrehalose trehalohydrolase
VTEPRWQPTLGAWVTRAGATFRVWAPNRNTVELLLRRRDDSHERRALAADADGHFHAAFDDVRAGDLYSYSLDEEAPVPDPASRFQPRGVHGPSEVVDASHFTWSDAAWRGRTLDDAVIYELHVGTFTGAGTFAGAEARLPELAELGITVIELMPLADFPGARNWGYDGVSLFAPSRAYGAPDDLRRFVDRAHAHGLAVILDVVYNHFGPDGAYFSRFSPSYLSNTHSSPWGAAVNLDGPDSANVRAFFIENALHWLHEYHFDGLRLDATHALVDASRRHFVAELAARARASLPERQLLLFAEDERNLAEIVLPAAEGGWGLDGVWADDFHHQVRRMAAGDSDGYYADFSGSVADLAATIRDGWFYQGQYSAHNGAPRGTDPSGLPRPRMVVCLQNHDQIGNRALGERLHHQIPLALYRALSALLLFVPETPLLFMGQEWAASTPFLYFTDHHAELGRLVTEGRRGEFSRFAAFADPANRERIPDPQAPRTFEASRLDWREREREPHASTLTLYQALLALRRNEPSLRAPGDCAAEAIGPDTLAVVRASGADTMALVLCLSGPQQVDLSQLPSIGSAPRAAWSMALTTDPDARLDEAVVSAPGACAVVVRAT